MTVDITPPPAVIEFAEKAGYKWSVEFVREWKDYQVFFPNLNPSITVQDNGLPQYILLKDNKIRWANNVERGKLMYLDNQE